jgi:hypothetical protein
VDIISNIVNIISNNVDIISKNYFFKSFFDFVP